MHDTVDNPPTLALLREKRDAILAIAERYQASNIRIFGSVARGEAAPGSDIDFLVDFAPDASLYDLSGLRRELMDLLGVPIDVVEDHQHLRDRFRRRISPDVVPL